MFDYPLKLSRKVKEVHQVPVVRTVNVYPNRRQIRSKRNPQQNAEVLREMEREFQARSEAAYKYGFKDGKKIGLQEGREEVRQGLECIKYITDELKQRRENFMKEADELVLQLAVRLAERIIRKEVKTDPEVVKNVARECLKLVEERQRICIRVHPSDWQVINEFEEEILTSTHGVKSLEIKEDDHVTPGGCIIESDSGIVDAQLETQLQEISESLMEAV